MGSLGTFVKGAPLSKADISSDGTPFILYGELYTTYSEVTYNIVRKTEKSVESIQMSRVGDVIIPTSGETPEEIATATCVMTPGVILAGDLNIYRTKHIDGRFVSYLINHSVNYDISRIAQGKSVVHIKADELAKICLSYPSAKEQEKILEFLAVLNSRIEKQRRLVELLKSYKRGVLAYVFQELSDNNSCAKKAISDLFEKVSARNKDGRIKNVITNSAEYGLIPQRSFFDKDIAVDGNTEGYYIIEPGDFVYNPRKSNYAPYGPFNVYSRNLPGIVSPLYVCLRPISDVSIRYLFWYFQSSAWHRYMYDNGSQGVRHDRVSITDSILMGIPVALPCISQQNAIAVSLDRLQLLYNKNVAILKQMNSVKTSLANQMLI